MGDLGRNFAIDKRPKGKGRYRGGVVAGCMPSQACAGECTSAVSGDHCDRILQKGDWGRKLDKIEMHIFSFVGGDRVGEKMPARPRDG